MKVETKRSVLRKKSFLLLLCIAVLLGLGDVAILVMIPLSGWAEQFWLAEVGSVILTLIVIIMIAVTVKKHNSSKHAIPSPGHRHHNHHNMVADAALETNEHTHRNEERQGLEQKQQLRLVEGLLEEQRTASLVIHKVSKNSS